MSLDFALKDFYRKKSQTYLYVLIIALVIGLAIFMIYFSTSIGLNLFIQYLAEGKESTDNEYYFSGAINEVYTQFNILILVLILILTFIVVVVITTTLIINKKKDIAIMKALGTLPDKLYGLYIIEAYIIFLIGFGLGYIFGLIGFGIISIVFILLGYRIFFHFDVIYTPILFFTCFFGIFFISGFVLRRIGNRKIIKSFSKDIPYSYDAAKRLTIIPRWLSKHGFN